MTANEHEFANRDFMTYVTIGEKSNFKRTTRKVSN